MTLPSKSAFGQEEDRIRRAAEERQRHPLIVAGPPDPPPLPPGASQGVGGAGPGQPVEQYRQQIASLDKASNEALYYDLDQALSLVTSFRTVGRVADLNEAERILERLRDDAYRKLR